MYCLARRKDLREVGYFVFAILQSLLRILKFKSALVTSDNTQLSNKTLTAFEEKLTKPISSRPLDHEWRRLATSQHK